MALAEIGPLLDADATLFIAALADVEQQLIEQIEELIAQRDTLHRLADGDRALLPDRAVALLERMPGLQRAGGVGRDDPGGTLDRGEPFSCNLGQVRVNINRGTCSAPIRALSTAVP